LKVAVRRLRSSLGFLIAGTILLACTNTSTSDVSSIPQDQMSDSTISGSLSEPTGFIGEVPWSPLVRISVLDFASLCVYYQENGFKAPNQKQLEVLQESRDGIYETAMVVSTIYQEFLLELHFYIERQLAFWEEFPEANAPSLSLSMIRNPCEIAEVKAYIAETLEWVDKP